MKAKELLFKAKSNPYFKTFEGLIKTSTEDYFKNKYSSRIIQYRDKDGLSTYDDSRYDFIKNRVYRFLTKYNQKITFDFGIHTDLEANFKIEYASHFKDELIKLKVNISDPSTGKRFYFDVEDNFNLKNPIHGLKKLIATELYESGLIALLQYNRGINKKDASAYFKIYLQTKKMHLHNGIDEDKVKAWIKRKFNIVSHLYLDQTIKIVNEIGKQKTVKKLFSFDTSFLNYFDGDVNELENEFYESNPIDENIIYA